MQFNRQQWETYAPKKGDNQERFAKGEPDVLTVQLKRPTARAWRQWWDYVAQDPALMKKIMDLQERHGREGAAGLLILQSLNNDPLCEILWKACVGPFAGFILADEDGRNSRTVTDPAEVWDLRDTIDDADLYADILLALVQKSRLQAGLARFLGPGSPPSVSPPADNGVVPSAALKVSTE